MEPNNQAAKPYAKYFFLQVGVIALLYTAIGTFIGFAFGIINYIFPDRQAFDFDPFTTTLRSSVSVLIVVFPLLVYLGRVIFRDMLANPDYRSFPIRKWLSYLTVFISIAVGVAYLIRFINTFLDGEISARFIAKLVLMLVVIGLTLWYTLKDLNGSFFARPKILKAFTVLVSAIVLATIIGGFFIIGSPATQRKLRDDANRVNDLSSVQYSVLEYYRRTSALPASLDAMKDGFNQIWQEEQFNDPVTKLPYEYSKITGTTSIAFELCATFDLASPHDLDGRGMYGRGGMGMDYAITYPSMPEFGLDQGFRHTEGRNCFTRTIDPVMYPPYEKN